MIGLQTGWPSGARLLAEGAERVGERRAGRARAEQERAGAGAGEQKSRKSRRAEREQCCFDFGNAMNIVIFQIR